MEDDLFNVGVDEFALSAMEIILDHELSGQATKFNPDRGTIFDPPMPPEDIAGYAYRIADAMVEEQLKRQTSD